jgi:hypothetical protein
MNRTGGDGGAPRAVESKDWTRWFLACWAWREAESDGAGGRLYNRGVLFGRSFLYTSGAPRTDYSAATISVISKIRPGGDTSHHITY